MATKYTNVTPRKDTNAAGNHRGNMVQALEASLKRLRTDYVDLYWVHTWNQMTPVEEVVYAESSFNEGLRDWAKRRDQIVSAFFLPRHVISLNVRESGYLLLDYFPTITSVAFTTAVTDSPFNALTFGSGVQE